MTKLTAWGEKTVTNKEAVKTNVIILLAAAIAFTIIGYFLTINIIADMRSDYVKAMNVVETSKTQAR